MVNICQQDLKATSIRFLGTPNTLSTLPHIQNIVIENIIFQNAVVQFSNVYWKILHFSEPENKQASPKIFQNGTVYTR